MSSPGKFFSAADYVVFFGLLSISTAIGIFYAWKDRKEKDADAYLVGKREMAPIPVAISMCVSYISGVMMIGMPTQLYFYGVIILWYSLVFLIGTWITGIYYIPLFFRLDIISVYEILEIRFGRVSRICAATSVLLLMITYMGMVTYVPCLALSAVSPISIPLSITLTCLICTFYTTLGGIKAVIWTDVVQALVMIFGMISVIVVTTKQLGGFSNVAAKLADGDRLNIVDFSFDPRVRNSTWSLVLGTVVVWTMMTAVNQPVVQRYLSCRNEQQAKRATWIFLIPQQLFFFLAVITGMVMYAYFANCDPVVSGSIRFPDQALPFMVLEVFQNIPGLAGIFVAAIYSGTMSTISSGINALSAVVLSDYLLKWRPSWKERSLRISKMLVLILGFVVLGMTFLVQAMGKMVIDVFLSAFGSIGGPLMAVYTMGIFMPWLNEQGAVAGHLLSTAITLWISIGQALHPPPRRFSKIRPLSINGCSASQINASLIEESVYSYDFNYTTEVDYFSGELPATSAAFVPQQLQERDFLSEYVYAISNNYIGLIGFLLCIIFGVIVSGFTGFEDPENANTDIFTPLIDNKLLPAKVIKFFRFGVPIRQRVQSSDFEMKDSELSLDKVETVI